MSSVAEPQLGLAGNVGRAALRRRTPTTPPLPPLPPLPPPPPPRRCLAYGGVDARGQPDTAGQEAIADAVNVYRPTSRPHSVSAHASAALVSKAQAMRARAGS
ncbi:hypothetical protein ACJQWK_03169 [Exserohilum turcicum]